MTSSSCCSFPFSCHQIIALQWRHNGRDYVSNHQPHDCLLNCLFRRRSNKASKLRVTGLCAGNSPLTGEFPAQMASNAENVSIWRRHYGTWLRAYGDTCRLSKKLKKDPTSSLLMMSTKRQAPGQLTQHYRSNPDKTALKKQQILFILDNIFALISKHLRI